MTVRIPDETILDCLRLFAGDIEGWANDPDYRRPTAKVMMAWAGVMEDAAVFMAAHGVKGLCTDGSEQTQENG